MQGKAFFLTPGALISLAGRSRDVTGKLPCDPPLDGIKNGSKTAEFGGEEGEGLLRWAGAAAGLAPALLKANEVNRQRDGENQQREKSAACLRC